MRKKRILGILLTAVMLMGLLPVTAAAEETTHTHCVCGATHAPVGEHTGEQSIEWTLTATLSDDMESKNYYLTEDVTLDSNWTPPSGMVLCLNGHDITFTSGCVYLRNNDPDFTLTDCKPNEDAGKITGGTGYSNNGGGVYVRGGTFTMYGGIITGNTATNGGGVYLHNSGSANSNFYLYGGEISGNNFSLGDVYFGDLAYVEVAGSPMIGQLYMQNPSKQLTIGKGGLSGNASIKVKVNPPSEYFNVTGVNDKDYSGYFSSWNETYPICNVDNQIRICKMYTVKFYLDMHGEAFTDKVFPGSKITKPEDPVADGYTFENWYKNSFYSNEKWIFEEDFVTADNMILYAKWTLNLPDVTSEGYTGVYDAEEHDISVSASHDAHPNMNNYLTYQWYKDGKDEGNKIDGATSATYRVKNVEDSGTYYCKVTADDNAVSNATNKLTSEAWSGLITVFISKQEITPPDIADKVFTGNTLTANVSDTEVYTVEKNEGGTNVGEYDVVLRLKNPANYKWPDSDNEDMTLKFNIVKAGSQITPADTDITATYGDTITLTAEVGIQNNSTLASFDVPNQVGFFCGEELIGTADVVYNDNRTGGTATLDYNTSDRKLAVGENTITAYYGGSVNLNGSDGDSIKVTLNKRELTVTAADQTIDYGESVVTGTDKVSVAGLVEPDALVAVTLVGSDGKVVPSAAVIKNGGTDVTEYYNIQYVNGTLKYTTYTVTLNTNGGTIHTGDLSEYVYKVGAVLPTDVTKDGYRFAGWYDNADFTGSPVSEITTTDSGNKTFYAKWDKISNSKAPSVYDVQNSDDVANGNVTVSRDQSSKGNIVTITVIPDAGYELDKLTVTDAKGNVIEVTKVSETEYTFRMPDSDVSVETSFREIGTQPVTDGLVIVATIGEKEMLIDDDSVMNDVAPMIKEGRTVLPIRVIAEALGATVTWNEPEQTVTIVRGDTTIVIYIDQMFALVNGDPVELDVAAFIVNGRTYLPVRFVAETLNASVSWDAATQSVTIIG